MLIPGELIAVPVLQVKSNSTVAAAKSELGTMEITNDCEPPAAMSTAVSGVPVTSLVAGSVVWNEKDESTAVANAIVHPSATTLSGLSTVAKAVAVVPIGTDRLEGSTAEKGVAAAGSACRQTSVRSPAESAELILVLVIVTIPFYRLNSHDP